MYFLTSYPKYRDVILEDVIDPYTILTWHHQYPVSEFEKYKLTSKASKSNKNIIIWK